MHELPLVFFTVLAQASVGVFVLMTLLTLLKKATPEQMDKAALISFVLIVVAGFSAVFHLGQPFRAFNALFGAGRSPMSNEILICGIFGACVFVYVASKYVSWISQGLKTIISVLATLSGIALVLTIPEVYQLNSVPTWDTPITSLQLILTAFICGGAIATSLTKHTFGCFVSCLGILVMLAVSPSYFAFLSQAGGSVIGADSVFWGIKYVLLAIGFMLLVLYCSKSETLTNPRLAYIASVLFIVAEVAGRIGFYDLWAIGM
ncbi:MAG: dimethyl sulfoxide reductase anchor subunit family protein [Vibrio sp.]